jgi:N-acetylglucosamine repressor
LTVVLLSAISSIITYFHGEKNMALSGAPSCSSTQRHSLRALRDTNVTTLLAAIWNHGPISRSDLARVTGLAPSSITRLTRNLQELGLILEQSKGPSSGGRQPVLLAIDATAGLVVAIDLSGLLLRGALMDATGQLVCTVERPFAGVGAMAIGNQVEQMVAELLVNPILDGRNVLGIGISVPGRVDRMTGTIEDATNLDVRDLRLGDMLLQRFDLPVWGEHDTIAAALAEKYHGAGQGASNLIYITVSSGIGAGIIIDNEPYRGENRLAGELGHVTVERDGQVCPCGKRGCLETVASGAAIVATARRVFGRGRDIAALERGTDADPITVEVVARAAMDGDHLAQEILSSAADYLAMAISTLACILDVRLVIIGGEVAEVGDVFFRPLHEALTKYQLYSNVPDIVPAQLRHDAPLTGIGMVTLQRVLGLVH